jgi:general secretion pathway protein A
MADHPMSATPDHWAPTAPFEEPEADGAAPTEAPVGGRLGRRAASSPAPAALYAAHFGLKQEPFSIAPDPRYLFMSERHREALAHLLYGVGGGGGFVLLTGEIGAGKTTVCRCFLEQIPSDCDVAYIFNPKLTVTELLQTVCEEFHVPLPAAAAGAGVKAQVDALNAFLLTAHAQGRNSVLIIDEAQNLSAEVLEQLRLLTNLETGERKLLQIILIGQPELREMLARPELEQLAQRVIARYHLQALSEAETAQYVRHRLAVAGLKRHNPFERAALRRIHQLAAGVPRRINLLCSRALLGAYASDRPRVDVRIVERAAREVFGGAAARQAPLRAAAWGAAAVLAVAALGALALWGWRQVHPPAAVAAAPALKRAPLAAGAGHVAAAARPASIAGLAAHAPVQATIAGPLIGDESAAWRALAPLWRADASAMDPCALADLQCFRHANTTLAQIRQLDRPGLLRLQPPGEAAGYALLVGLGPRSAVLRVGGVDRSVTLAALATAWHGDYATYWRPPPGYTQPADADSPAVRAWLNAQLARWAGASGSSGSDLKPRIAAFQIAQGLAGDGLAGPMTFMQLDRALGVAEPRLQSAP